jgi:predicted permease
MRWSRFFHRKHWDEERARELEAYLEIETDENLARGMSPEQAHQAARRKLGNPTFIREEIYRMNSIQFFESVWQDVRYAARTLAKSRAFTFVVIASLALGIGANTAIFSLVNAALLKMLPVRNPEQLVEFKVVRPALGIDDAFPYPALQEFRVRRQALSGVLAFRGLNDVNVEVNGSSGLAKGQVVSGDYFPTLGVNAILGRVLEPRDEKIANPVAVISYNYWRKRFALDPAVVGKHVVINNSPFTIIGVTPPEFFGLQPGESIDVFVPLTTMAQVSPGYAMAGTRVDVLTAPWRNWLRVMARLKPGATKVKASANLQPVFHQSMREAAEGLAGLPFDSPAARRLFLASKLRLDSGGQGLAALRQKYSKPLWILMAITGLLLLVTCANVANLMLARANGRQKELAVRLSVGAGRLRLIRQFLTESVLLALCGAAVGVVIALWACRSLLSLMSHTGEPLSLSVQPDTTVLGFTLLISVFTALLFGLVPAWRAARLKIESTRMHGRSESRSRLGKTLVVLQIGLSLVLMIGAGLLVRSLENLEDFYPGFNKGNVLLFSVDPGLVGYNDNQLASLYGRLLDRISRTPGVRSTTFSIHSPLGSGHGSTQPKIDGGTPQSVKEMASVGVNVVGPNYFTTLQIPVLTGRDFTVGDQAGAPKVAIVNQVMAHDYFGDASPIGHHLSVPGWRGDPSWLAIVGVTKDTKNHDLREVSEPMIYLPLFQAPESGVTFEVRTAIDPHNAARAILHAVKAIDSRLPVAEVKTLTEQVDQSLIQERLVASLSSLFGALALLLVGVGLYGLMTYAVNRRTGEIGIRMALGASRGQVASMILRETLQLVLIGLGIGIPAAIAASRLIKSELYGLKSDDPITLLVAVSIMAGIALLAAYLPARRASRVEPMAALRTE